MTVLPVPAGWNELDKHLIDWHGFDSSYVDDIDSDRAREVHAWAHRERIFAGGRSHSHDE